MAGTRLGAARRAKTPPGELRATLRALAAWAGRICITRPGEVAGSLLALGAAVYVSCNALGFQAGRHPAPILPRVPAEAATSLPAVRQIAAPARPVEPAPAKPAPTKPAPANPAEAPTKETARAAPHDPIGDLLRGPGETTASVAPRTGRNEAGRAKSDPSVILAQRALAKLGYGPLRDDGLMGPGTRAAIERFERDRKLPVKGEPAGRTLRELATRAGLPQG